jgi:hypothetical protein
MSNLSAPETGVQSRAEGWSRKLSLCLKLDTNEKIFGGRSRWVGSFTSRPLYSGENSRHSWRFRKGNTSSGTETEPRSTGCPTRSLVTIIPDPENTASVTRQRAPGRAYRVLGECTRLTDTPPLDCPQTLMGTPLPPREERSDTSGHSTGRLCYWLASCICPVSRDVTKLYCSERNESQPLTPKALTDWFS